MNKDFDFKAFRSDVESALQAVNAKYNGVVKAGAIKYDNASLTMSLAFSENGRNGESAEQNLFNQTCKDYGFTPDQYRASVTLQDKEFKLIGFNPRARKNFAVLEKDGTQYATTPQSVLESLNNPTNSMT